MYLSIPRLIPYHKCLTYLPTPIKYSYEQHWQFSSKFIKYLVPFCFKSYKILSKCVSQNTIKVTIVSSIRIDDRPTKFTVAVTFPEPQAVSIMVFRHQYSCNAFSGNDLCTPSKQFRGNPPSNGNAGSK